MSFWNKLVSFFIGLVKEMFDAAADAVADDAGDYLSLLVDTAKSAVLAAEATGGSGSDKWDAAKKMVVDKMTSQGANLLEVTIDTVLQNTVAVFKQNMRETLNPAAQPAQE